jgi:hypothetical protein
MRIVISDGYGPLFRGDLSAVPRAGDEVYIKSHFYKIIGVTWHFAEASELTQEPSEFDFVEVRAERG